MLTFNSAFTRNIELLLTSVALIKFNWMNENVYSLEVDLIN